MYLWTHENAALNPCRLHRILVGNQRERTNLGRGFLSFCLLGDNSVLSRYCLVQRLFCIFLLFSSNPWSGIFFLLFAFSHSLIVNFLFFFLPILWSGTFFSLFSSEGKVYGNLRFWLKASGKRGCPTLFPWYTCNNDDWKFYAKLVMHAPMWTLKCQVFMVMWC